MSIVRERERLSGEMQMPNEAGSGGVAVTEGVPPLASQVSPEAIMLSFVPCSPSCCVPKPTKKEYYYYRRELQVCCKPNSWFVLAGFLAQLLWAASVTS